jgi:putative nucleotidyltransferase with HDIG domain
VSAGVADVSEAGTPEALLRLAEEALHAAKHAGRNCTRTMGQIVRDSQEAAAIDREAVSSLQRQVERLSCESREMLVQSVRSLVRAVEARDPYTKHHSENVTQYAVAIAQTLGLGEEATAPIRRAAMIHDVGKIGVPDAILCKRGPLPLDERRVMEQHVIVGVCILEQLRFLDREVPMVRHHHERWAGQGYPDGIAGQGIPLGARILAVADAFDAITSDRPYRQARPVAEALKILQEEAGRQFDPGVVEALVQWVRDISQADGDPGDLMAADLLKPGAAAPA